MTKIINSYHFNIYLGMLCTLGLTCSTSFAISTSTVESVVPDLDPHRNNNNTWTDELCLEHSSLSQGSPR